MAQHGGYRTPSNPAPASGPGAMSQRTDGGPAQPVRAMTGGDYGDSQDMATLQSSAPMVATAMPQTQGQRASASSPGVALPTGMGAPTERPDEPVTAGSPLGAGPGPGVLTDNTLQGQSSREGEMFKKYLPALQQVANRPGAAPSFVRFVRHLRDM